MFELLLFGGLLGVGYFVGSRRESQHYKDIEARERTLKHIKVRSDKKIEVPVVEAQMMMSSVVIANDYFKMFLGSIRSIIGGQIRSQETLLDRGRREATLRLLAKAQSWGAVEVVGLRMDTSMIDSAGVEVFVYGTAIKR